MGVTFLMDRLPPRGQKLLGAFILLLVFVFFAAMVFAGAKMVGFTMTQLSSTMLIPMGYVYLAAPVGAGLCLLVIVESFPRTSRTVVRGGRPMSLILLGTFIGLLALSVPIAVCLGLASMVTLLVMGVPLNMLVQRMVASTDSFPIMAILFFMVAGEIMSKGNMTRVLIDFAQALLGSLRGGLAIAADFAAMFFSALSGSSAATCASIGTIMIREMERKGYPKDATAAIIASAGITGIVIPPSITLVVYGVVTGSSVAKLFIGGIIPGILLIGTQCVYNYFLAKKRGYGEVQTFSLGNVLVQIRQGFLVLIMPFVVLGGIYGGLFTPTEAGVVAVVYSVVVSVGVERSVSIRELGPIIIKGAVNAAVIMFIIQTATMFSWLMTCERVPHMLGEICAQISSSKIVFLLLLNVVFLIAGMLVTGSAIVAILAPIFLPVAISYGIDPVFMGVLMVVNLAIGYITPPVGVDLYVVSAIAGIPVSKVIGRVLPYLAILLIDLLLVTYIPWFIMFLPGQM